MGHRAGRVWREAKKPDAPWVFSSTPQHAHLEGFDLHANRVVRLQGTSSVSSSSAGTPSTLDCAADETGWNTPIARVT